MAAFQSAVVQHHAVQVLDERHIARTLWVLLLHKLGHVQPPDWVDDFFVVFALLASGLVGPESL